MKEMKGMRIMGIIKINAEENFEMKEMRNEN